MACIVLIVVKTEPDLNIRPAGITDSDSLAVVILHLK